MDDDSGYELIDDEELVHQILDDESLMPQILDHDTVPMPIPPSMRADTASEWPPQPPMPGEVNLAVGTLTDGTPVRTFDGVPPQRIAQIFAAVRRPTTSSESNDD